MLAENGLRNKPYKDLTIGDLKGLSLEALNNIIAKRYEESRRDDGR